MTLSGSVIANTKIGGYAAAAAAFAYLGINQESAALLMVLMVFDIITGVSKQYRLNKKKISSHTLVLGVMSKLFLFSCVLLFAWMTKVNNLGNEWFPNVIIAVLTMGEMYSCIQNTYTMHTGVILPEFDVVSKVLKLMLQGIKNILEGTLKQKLPK